MLAAQLTNELRALFPRNAVEYFVSYYDYFMPEAFNSASDTYIDKVTKACVAVFTPTSRAHIPIEHIHALSTCLESICVWPF